MNLRAGFGEYHTVTVVPITVQLGSLNTGGISIISLE